MKYKLISFFLFILIFISACGSDRKLYPSYTSLVAWIPSENLRVDVAVWFPTKRKPYTMTIEQWTFEASRNAKPAEGKFPVIIISHDTSGSRYSHHNLATKLAMDGFIVLAPLHSEDNIDSMDLFFTPQGLNLRANQISTALSLLLENKELEPHVDRENITVLGFGNGGTAALLLANAKLDASLWEPYCQNQRLANINDPYCVNPIQTYMNNFVAGTYTSNEQSKLFVLARENALKSRQNLLARGSRIITTEMKAIRNKNIFPLTPTPTLLLPYFPPLPQLTGVDDNRIQNIILISPGYFMLFDAESLAKMDVNTLFIGLERDMLNLPHLQSSMFTKTVGTNQYTLSMQDADVPTLQAPLQLSISLPGIDNIATEEERNEQVEKLYDILMSFYAQLAKVTEATEATEVAQQKD